MNNNYNFRIKIVQFKFISLKTSFKWCSPLNTVDKLLNNVD